MVLHNSLGTSCNNSGNDIPPVPLGEEDILEARTEGVKLSLDRRAGAVFFLTVLLSLTGKEFTFPKVKSVIFTHNLFRSNALLCAMEERQEQLMCSWQQAELHLTALRALSCFRCQHRECIRKNRQWINTSSKCWWNYDMIQALTQQTPKLRYNWGSFYLFKEDEFVS